MKIALTADIHLGNHRRFGGNVVSGINDRCRHILDALRCSVAIAEDKSCDLFLVLGDLFDTEKPSPQIIAEVQTILPRDKTIILCGNHDVASMAEGDHALGPLSPLFQVIGPNPETRTYPDAHLYLIPFLAGSSEVRIPEEILSMWKGRRPKTPALVCFHAGIADHDTPFFLQGASDAIQLKTLRAVMDQKGIGSSAAGNWHDHKQWPGVCQIGTLCPTGFDNPSPLQGEDPFGRMAIWDSETEQFESIVVPGPRFYVTRGLEELEAFRPPRAKSYLLAKVQPSDFESAQKVLARLMNEERILNGDVEIDRSEQREQVQKTSAVIRKRETLTEALAEFVNEYPFEGEVDRTKVLNRAREYLKL